MVRRDGLNGKYSSSYGSTKGSSIASSIKYLNGINNGRMLEGKIQT
jgi:hypothetical protein